MVEPLGRAEMETSTSETIQLSFPLPKGLNTRVYLHMTKREKHVILFLTTATPEEASKAPSMGSFVYAVPNVRSLSYQYIDQNH